MSVPDVKAIAVNSENEVEVDVQRQKNGTDSRVFCEVLKLVDGTKSYQGALKIIEQKIPFVPMAIVKIKGIPNICSDSSLLST